MIKTVRFADGTEHSFRDVRFAYGAEGEPCPGVLETYPWNDMEVSLLYCGESVESVPDTEAELDDWQAYPVPGACFHFDPDGALYRVTQVDW